MSIQPRRNNTPLALPEVVKAYQDDPRTKLAQAALANGTSTAPVAGGGWAWADGIARVLGGMAGAYTDKKQQERYAHGDKGAIDPGAFKGSTPQEYAAWAAAQNQRGQDGALAILQDQAFRARQAPPAAQAAPAAPQAAPTPPSGLPAVAAQGATILQGSPAPQATPSAPAMPGAAPPPPRPAVVPAAAGGGPMGQRPFSASSAPVAPKYNTAIGQQEVPDAPPPVDIQAVEQQIAAAAPKAVGPTRSKLLDAAYDIMLGANPYLAGRGADMYSQGLGDQTKLDEAAAEREQHLRDMGFQVAANAYGEGLSQDRNAAHEMRRNITQNNFTAGQGKLERDFTGAENAKNRALTASEGAKNRSSEMALAQYRAAAELQQIDRQGGWQMKIHDADNAARAKDRLSSHYSTAAGQKQYVADTNTINQSAGTIQSLRQYQQINKAVRTGGLVNGTVPNLATWANSKQQMLKSIENSLALQNAANMKGSLSDKDVVFLKGIGPSIMNSRSANDQIINRAVGVLQRQQDFILARQRAIAEGDPIGFQTQWSAYATSEPSESGKSFDDWKAEARARANAALGRR